MRPRGITIATDIRTVVFTRSREIPKTSKDERADLMGTIDMQVAMSLQSSLSCLEETLRDLARLHTDHDFHFDTWMTQDDRKGRVSWNLSIKWALKGSWDFKPDPFAYVEDAPTLTQGLNELLSRAREGMD